jgi:clan AA aspartic protease (TIGR02281 family)
MVTQKFDPNTLDIILFAVIHRGKNKRQIRVVLDTGPTYVLIPWYVAHELGYKPGLSKEWTPVATANGLIYAPKIDLELITTLGLSVKNVSAVCHDLPPESRVDGLLGLSYLRNFKLTLDFKKGILELE